MRDFKQESEHIKSSAGGCTDEVSLGGERERAMEIVLCRTLRHTELEVGLSVRGPGQALFEQDADASLCSVQSVERALAAGERASASPSPAARAALGLPTGRPPSAGCPFARRVAATATATAMHRADGRQNVAQRAVGGPSWQHQPIDDEETFLVTQDRPRQLRGLTPCPS
ncbi:hypothetical protein PSPO01_02923 [Paraphaeosphaeria sporulosa]